MCQSQLIESLSIITFVQSLHFTIDGSYLFVGPLS